jgi:DegV family protein with EDD domain
MEGFDYTTVPMKVITSEKEYIDTPDLDVLGMVNDLRAYKGKSGSSCPNVQEWLDAFGDAEQIFGLTISRNLSGSYNAASQAAEEYMQAHPGRRVFILDSLSAGPEQFMLADKIRQLAEQGLDFDAIVQSVMEYQNHTHILFCLESMNNLARNGRVNPAVAKLAGLLGIRAAGDAEDGQIVPVHKPRGDKKATQVLVDMMLERGLYDGALVRIAHCFGEENALALKKAILEKLPGCRFIIEPTGALCSFYAEAGGLMIGMEGGFNKVNNNLNYR